MLLHFARFRLSCVRRMNTGNAPFPIFQSRTRLRYIPYQCFYKMCRYACSRQKRFAGTQPLAQKGALGSARAAPHEAPHGPAQLALSGTEMLLSCVFFFRLVVFRTIFHPKIIMTKLSFDFIFIFSSFWYFLSSSELHRAIFYREGA